MSKSDFANMSFKDEALEKAEKELENVAKFGGSFIPFFANEYPKLLLSIPNPPILLTGLGNFDILNDKIIAIVGSRSASYNGLKMSETFAKRLCESGFTIASGLARGIDSKAHWGGIKSTVAVIGSGINIQYPQENSKLYDAIISNNSCIITEFPFDLSPIPANFPQRNRIIAGISLGTLVVEAGMKSGSLSTARLTFEYGREVFAIPGFALDPNYKGNNYLIKKNIAKLVENTEDIIEDLPDFIDIKPRKTSEIKADNLLFTDVIQQAEDVEKSDKDEDVNLTDEDIILNSLTNQYIGINEICQRTGFDAAKVNIFVMQLEMFGKIVSNGMGFCRKFD